MRFAFYCQCGDSMVGEIVPDDGAIDMERLFREVHGGTDHAPATQQEAASARRRGERRRQAGPGIRGAPDASPGSRPMSGTCSVCGTSFEAQRATRRYCSAACRLAHHRDPGLSVTNPALWAAPTTELSVEPAAPPTYSIPTVSAAPRHTGRPLAAIAAGIPTPADEYGPSRAYCEVRDGGYGVVFGRDGGRRNEPAGPTFPRPRQAIALADLLNGRLSA